MYTPHLKRPDALMHTVSLDQAAIQRQLGPRTGHNPFNNDLPF